MAEFLNKTKYSLYEQKWTTMDENAFYISNESVEKDFHLLTAALHSSKSGVIITDNQQPDNPIIFCNEAFENMSGYKRGEIIGKNCRFLQGNDRNQDARFELLDALEKGRSCRIELRNYRKNGSLFWNELYMAPITNDENVITHFIGVQNDVTERKKAEAVLQKEKDILEKRIREKTSYLNETEEYLTAIVQSLQQSVLVLDKDIMVISANTFFYKTFRTNEDDVVGKLFFDLDSKNWHLPELRRALEIVLPLNMPFENFEVNGEFTSVEKQSFLLSARRIETTGIYSNRILLTIEDQTERKRKEMNKDDFLSIASHELKTPLTTIKGYMQIIEMMFHDDANEKVKSLLQRSVSSIDKLNRLIVDLLDASKVQAGKVQLHYEQFDFDRMVSDCIEIVQATTKIHQIKMEGITGLRYYGDSQRLEQVLINLLTNAIKYSPDSDEILVRVSLVSNFIKVSVTDYGVGIKQEDYKKIFERFYRVHDIQHRFSGMGIGLYISEQIIEKHHGSLWVESEEAKGSTFSFTLPITTNQKGIQSVL